MNRYFSFSVLAGLVIAGTSACTQLSPNPVGGHNGQVTITSQYSGSLPDGSVATIRLYDSMLMDTDSTYGLHSLPIAQLPMTLPLPRKDNVVSIVGPAVGVSIRDKDGQLIFINDTSTPLAENGATQIVVKSIR